MTRKYAFQPSVLGLESRLVLSQRPKLATAAVTSRMNPSAAADAQNAARQAAIAAPVNIAFAQFLEDYSQARANYFGGVRTKTAVEPDRTAFITYTIQRLDLLEKQITSGLIQATRSRSGAEPSSQLLAVTQSIDAMTASAKRTPLQPYRKNTLGKALIDSTPPISTSPTALTLYTLAQDNAIEASRVSIVNALSLIKPSTAGGKSHK